MHEQQQQRSSSNAHPRAVAALGLNWSSDYNPSVLVMDQVEDAAVRLQTYDVLTGAVQLLLEAIDSITRLLDEAEDDVGWILSQEQQQGRGPGLLPWSGNFSRPAWGNVSRSVSNGTGSMGLGMQQQFGGSTVAAAAGGGAGGSCFGSEWGAYGSFQDAPPEVIIQEQQKKHLTLHAEGVRAKTAAAVGQKRVDQLMGCEEGRRLVGLVGQRAVQLHLHAVWLRNNVDTLQALEQELDIQIQQKSVKEETLNVGQGHWAWGFKARLRYRVLVHSSIHGSRK